VTSEDVGSGSWFGAMLMSRPDYALRDLISAERAPEKPAALAIIVFVIGMSLCCDPNNAGEKRRRDTE